MTGCKTSVILSPQLRETVLKLSTQQENNMKKLTLAVLLLTTTQVFALGTLVSSTKMTDISKTVCVYSDGSSTLETAGKPCAPTN